MCLVLVAGVCWDMVVFAENIQCFLSANSVQSGALNRDKISSIFATAKRRNLFKKIPADSRYYGSTSIL